MARKWLAIACTLCVLAVFGICGRGQEAGKKRLTKAEIDAVVKSIPPGLPKKDLEVIRKYLENLPASSSKELIDQLRRALANNARHGARDHYPLPHVDHSDARIYNRLGVRLDCPTEEMLIELGVPDGMGQVIVEVYPGMSGAQAGFKKGDLIIELAGKDVSNDAAKFGKALKAVTKGARVNAVVLRTGRMQTVGPIVFND